MNIFGIVRRVQTHLTSTYNSSLLLPRSGTNVISVATQSSRQDLSTAAKTPKNAPHPSESFLNGNMGAYAEGQYRMWKQDPSKVHASWATFFQNLDAGLPPGAAYQAPPSLGGPADGTAPVVTQAIPSYAHGQVEDLRAPATNLVHLIRAYQIKGHEAANLDPLGIMDRTPPADLDYRTYNFTDADLDREFTINGFPGITGYMASPGPVTLRQLIDNLKASYCGTIGVEYMHIPDRDRCNFLRERFEIPNAASTMLSKEEKLQVVERITFAERFETYLAKKWATAKRFGLEGCESLIPGMKTLVDRSTELGVESVVIGMPHRGRLNVLANVVRKPFEQIFAEFAGTSFGDPDKFFDELTKKKNKSTGDVKYHLGCSFDRQYPPSAEFPQGRKVHLTLMANPSHLEAVDPLVIGKARAKQYFLRDKDGTKVLPILMHGDAAFCGQGVVYETMQMEHIRDYSPGGTIHIVVNNQIGFTTIPQESRGTRYATDLGKAFNSPVFHVNADDPEACAYVFKMAAEYRQKFLSNVIVDIVGYRRYGHNEVDNPSFTNPTMYNVIQNHTRVMTQCQQRYVQEGVMDDASVNNVNESVQTVLETAFDKSRHMEEAKPDWLQGQWKHMKSTDELATQQVTGVPHERLQEISQKIFTPPEGFTAHRTVKRILELKREAVQKGTGLDWGAAEALAYGSMVDEGHHVRISGQDVQRGTFSHRHAVIHDQKNGDVWCGLQNISPGKQEEFHAFNSPLSEFGVMGFELGYSMENPDAMVIWEAQFGDFVNGAQTIIDQFISCQEAKWLRQSGLTLLLPHGYDGQGPEHSSCRMERFLTLSDEDPDVIPANLGTDDSLQIQHNNWQVVNASTPAQIFHVLRRQMKRDFRKPLIVVSPKYLLKLKECQSKLSEISEGTTFQRLLPEVDEEVMAQPDESIQRLIFCVGKVYYDLAKARKAMGEEGLKIAIVRIEQITPFPFDLVAEQVGKYKNAELVYVQEEPKNMGPWYFIDDRIFTSTRVLLGNGKHGRRCEFVGRKSMASPAVGSSAVHEREQKYILNKALDLSTKMQAPEEEN